MTYLVKVNGIFLPTSYLNLELATAVATRNAPAQVFQLVHGTNTLRWVQDLEVPR